MNGTKFEFQHLRQLLRRRSDDPGVVDLIQRDPVDVERSDYIGFVELREAGIAVMFKEEPWIILPDQVTDPSALRVCAFHLYAEGHEGYSSYRGRLPNGVDFGDPEAQVIRKMGEPSATGGGGWSTTLQKVLERWLRYLLDDDILRFQLDSNGRVELVTLEVPIVAHLR